MADRQMIAFHEIFSENFPIRVPNMGFIKGLNIVRHVVITDMRLNASQILGDGVGVGIERHKDPAKPFFAANARKHIVTFAKARVLRHCRCTAQTAIKIIGPGMIGADNRRRGSASFQKR